MKIYYKTIINADSNIDLEIMGREDCCREMTDLMEFIISELSFGEMSYDAYLWLGFKDEDGYNYYIFRFCPFCGEKIVTKEKLKVKRIAKTRMVEQLITEYEDRPIE